MTIAPIISDLENIVQRLKTVSGQAKAERQKFREKRGKNQTFLLRQPVGESWHVDSRSKMIAMRESASALKMSLTAQKDVDGPGFTLTLVQKPIEQ